MLILLEEGGNRILTPQFSIVHADIYCLAYSYMSNNFLFIDCGRLGL